jgi:hypothetical protein
MLAGFMHDVPFFNKYVAFSFFFLFTDCFRPLNIIWQGDGEVYSSLSNIILEHNGEPVFDSGNIDIE